MDREAKLTKDVRVAMENANSNKKSAEERKKRAYDMARNIQYLKDEMEDSRDKSNCLQVEVVNIQGLKRSIELIAGNLDRELLEINMEMKVQIFISPVSTLISKNSLSKLPDLNSTDRFDPWIFTTST